MQINSSDYYMSAYAASATYQSGNFSLSGSYLEITGGMSTNSADGIDVSEKAKEMLDRIKNLDVFKIIYPNSDVRSDAKSLGDIQNDFMSDFNNFSSTFSKMAQMMGMDPSSSLTMGLDGKGGMTIGGDSAAADKMSEALNNGSPASQTTIARFAVMAARTALVDAGNTVDGFANSYAQDPYSAITENIDALKERLLGFRTQAGNGTMNYGFMRGFSMNIDYSKYSVSYGQGGDAADADAVEADAEVVEDAA